MRQHLCIAWTVLCPSMFTGSEALGQLPDSATAPPRLAAMDVMWLQLLQPVCVRGVGGWVGVSLVLRAATHGTPHRTSHSAQHPDRPVPVRSGRQATLFSVGLPVRQPPSTTRPPGHPTLWLRVSPGGHFLAQRSAWMRELRRDIVLGDSFLHTTVLDRWGAQNPWVGLSPSPSTFVHRYKDSTSASPSLCGFHPIWVLEGVWGASE